MSRFYFILFVAVAFSAAQSMPGPEVPFVWTAYPEAGDMSRVNPAGFSFLDHLQLRVGAAASDTAFEGFDAISLELPGCGLSGWWEDAESMRRFSSSGSIGLFGGMAALGVAYDWLDPTVKASPWNGADRWSIGLLVRPSDWLSFGMVRHGEVDLSGADDLEPVYRAGLAVRPMGDLLTLTADLETGTDFDAAEVYGGAELRPFSGLTLRLAAGEDMYRIGLEAGLGCLSVSGAVMGAETMDYSGTRAELILSSAPGENLLAPSGYFIRFTPGDVDELPVRPFLGSVQPCFTDQVLLLRRIASDPAVAGVIVDIENGAFNAAQAEELRELLQDIRDSGKKVYAWLQDGGNGAYYLASCADKIWIHPCGHVNFNGLGMETFFARELLDGLGIYPDLLHIGDYKSASDMLTRTNMSEAQREASTELLMSMQDVIVDAVMQSRGLEPAQINVILSAGGYTASRAVTAGLVDGIAYSDQVEDLICEEPGGGAGSVSLAGYASTLPREVAWGPDEHVAVIVATGFIVTGTSGSSLMLGRTMGSESICNAIKTASSAPGVRALVIRIDSGGGDALASDDMHHAVANAMREIPVVVSMGAVAASGGYYMACGADRIFADRLTITGSIGIISGKFSIGELMENIGVNVEEIEGAPMSTMYSTFRPFSEEERGRVNDLMRDGYEIFVNRVAEGRSMSFEEVDAIGQGRVWSGADALALGLIDEWGGVADAVTWAARSAGMDPTGVPEIIIYPVPSFPGSFGFPGAGVTSELMEMLTGELYLYMSPPLAVE